MKKIERINSNVVLFLLCLVNMGFWPQTETVAQNVPNQIPPIDFLYAGEAPFQNIYILKNGEITWQYNGPTDEGYLGEVSDAVLMTTGNILFSYQKGIALMSPQKEILWQYKTPENCETHSAQPIGEKYVVFVQNGNPAKVIVMDIKANKEVHSFEVPVKNPSNVHGHFRHARLTKQGTYLLAHMDLGKVCEYDVNGKVLFSFDAPGVWGVEPMKNGNMMLCGGKLGIKEVNKKGQVLWSMSVDELNEKGLEWPVLAICRPNGNLMVTSWTNTFNGPPVDRANPPVQAIEITREKQLVWKLSSWNEPADLGPATTIQVLSDKGISEKVSFGKYK
ncbi:hypothetical protein [Maribellus sediminis]|uniref:beta-propeller domain-containing protein n=1 Tax=Maribellus sediminis TaxID=2696285 RepID=UPI00142FBD47|nr:hypothetical protein [Maribellus sediminis]